MRARPPFAQAHTNREFTILLLALLLVQGCVTGLGLRQGEVYYTNANIWYRNPTVIKTTNYHMGALIPFGTKVTVQKPKRHRLTLRTESGLEFTLIHVKRHSNVSLQDHFQRYFSKTDPKASGGLFDSFSDMERQDIGAGNVALGMSKAAVLASYGYPPGHATPDLEMDYWRYWVGGGVQVRVTFIENTVARIQKVISSAPIPGSPVRVVDVSSTSDIVVESSPVAVSQGTCFAVREDGYLLTSAHVVEGAKAVRVRMEGRPPIAAVIERRDRLNDLALLAIPVMTPAHLSLSPPRSVRVGEPVFTMGYPVSGLLGEEPKYTEGSVSSLSGVEGAAHLLQVSIPIQPGNSGGPVVNDRGEVVGIIASTASILRFIRETRGSLPQNVNWAVKADYARPLFDPPTPLPETSSRESAIQRVRQALCFVEANRR